LPYSGRPDTVASDRIRLRTGDLFEDFEILDDDTYNYFISKYPNDETAAAIAAAKVIRFQIARTPTRETAGKYEVWSDFAALYTAALADLISGTDGSSLFVGMPYAGGISRQDMIANNMNSDVVRLCLPRISGCPYKHLLWDNDFYSNQTLDGDWL
jgi:hypothetical protein